MKGNAITQDCNVLIITTRTNELPREVSPEKSSRQGLGTEDKLLLMRNKEYLEIKLSERMLLHCLQKCPRNKLSVATIQLKGQGKPYQALMFLFSLKSSQQWYPFNLVKRWQLVHPPIMPGRSLQIHSCSPQTGYHFFQQPN